MKVLVAMSGADALSLARQFHPTAVSLDVFPAGHARMDRAQPAQTGPETRHIPVQIVTLDEDRQHGLARGAFSFINKPTTKEGLEAANRTHPGLRRSARKRLLVVEDNAGEQLSIKELLGHHDLDIVVADTGAAALVAMAEQPCDCVVLDLRLPDMSGFEVLQRIGATSELSDLPVVVFTGRELSPEEDMQLRTLARSIVVKGVESPERLLDETSLFLHRVLSELPADKQRMLERLHRSDDDLVGKAVLVVDDDVRNIFALSSVLERRGMKVLTASTGKEATRLLETTPDVAIVLMDIMMPDMDGYRTMQVNRQNPGAAPSADRGAHGQGHEGRPRKVLRSGRLRLSGQTGQHGPAIVGAAMWLHR
jgi:CheY-like chemotaxis protein